MSLHLVSLRKNVEAKLKGLLLSKNSVIIEIHEMNRSARIVLVCLLHLFLASASFAQLGSQDLPIPVTSNQIVGVIKPRRIGDDRLTRLFYSLDADKGDLFINVEAENLNGDLDLFIANNLKPLAKITIYAADTKTETGRVVYLRKPEKLLLRIEGRTPNDNPARFRIKFAGSFIARESSISENEDIGKGKTEEVTVVGKFDAQRKNEEEMKKLSKNLTERELEEKNEDTNRQAEVEEKQQQEEKDLKIAESQLRRGGLEELKPEEKDKIVENTEEPIKEEVKVIKEETAKKQVAERDEKETEIGEDLKVFKKEVKQKEEIEQDVEKQGEKVEEKRVVEKKEEVVAEKSKGNTEQVGEQPFEDISKQEKEAIEEEEKAKKEVENLLGQMKRFEKAEESGKTEKAGDRVLFANMFLVVVFRDGSKLEKPMQQVLSFKIDEESLVIVTKDGRTEIRKASDVVQVTIK